MLSVVCDYALFLQKMLNVRSRSMIVSRESKGGDGKGVSHGMFVSRLASLSVIVVEEIGISVHSDLSSGVLVVPAAM
ncbi:hypothetical protein Lal_00042575 [Lupinus albus]|nr:hypothetical protein Lal_00042575 [Lupinus albus]